MGGRMFKEKIVPLKPEKAIIVQSDVINKIKQKFSELKIIKLGSVGHKPDNYLHTDIDIGIQCETIENLKNIIDETFKGSLTSEIKSFYVVSLCYEYEFDKFIQIDFIMIHNIEFAKFRYYVPDYIHNESNYKTGMKIMFMSTVLNHCPERNYEIEEPYFGKFDWCPTGLYQYKINKKDMRDWSVRFFTDDLECIWLITGGEYSDFNSVESIWKFIHSDRFNYPDNVKDIELTWFINCYKKGWFSVKPEDFKLTYWTAEQINNILKDYKIEHVLNKMLQEGKEI